MNSVKRMTAEVLWNTGVGPLLGRFFAPRIVVIAYHSIRDNKDRAPGGHPYEHISIARDVFLDQIEYLAKQGYVFKHFRDLPSAVGKAACIYFDDGFRDVLENAYPILKQRGIPATLFLTTDYLDQKGAVSTYLRWDEARSMGDVFEFGSHSMSHPKLNKIPLREAEREMRESRALISQKLGADIVSFSYPRGRSSRQLEDLAHRVGYKLTTADARFHKVRPDPDDTFSIFKLRVALPWL